jgi:hypothetical protein
MSLSIYDVAVTPLLAGLTTLSTYLDKAEAYAADNKFDPSVLVNARLAPDMLPLAGQVQRASDSAKAAVGRLTGLEVPSYADTETTLPRSRRFTRFSQPPSQRFSHVAFDL